MTVSKDKTMRIIGAISGNCVFSKRGMHPDYAQDFIRAIREFVPTTMHKQFYYAFYDGTEFTNLSAETAFWTQWEDD